MCANTRAFLPVSSSTKMLNCHQHGTKGKPNEVNITTVTVCKLVDKDTEAPLEDIKLNHVYFASRSDVQTRASSVHREPFDHISNIVLDFRHIAFRDTVKSGQTKEQRTHPPHKW